MKAVWMCTTVVAAALIIAGGIYGSHLTEYGLSAREEPTAVERFVARTLRHAAIPATAKGLKNPLPATPEMLEHGRNH
ncbi:MAG: hypothetical protein WAK21_11420, partial [Candidatus Sulfotelmatobacter sp.]